MTVIYGGETHEETLCVSVFSGRFWSRDEVTQTLQIHHSPTPAEPCSVETLGSQTSICELKRTGAPDLDQEQKPQFASATNINVWRLMSSDFPECTKIDN